MPEVVAGSVFGRTERVFVYDKCRDGKEHEFVVRPAVVVVDGNQIRFRNFTDFAIRITADFFTARSVDLERKGGSDRKTVTLVPDPEPGFHDYAVEVNVNGEWVEAKGESRPGAIIDR